MFFGKIIQGLKIRILGCIFNRINFIRIPHKRWMKNGSLFASKWMKIVVFNIGHHLALSFVKKNTQDFVVSSNPLCFGQFFVEVPPCRSLWLQIPPSMSCCDWFKIPLVESFGICFMIRGSHKVPYRVLILLDEGLTIVLEVVQGLELSCTVCDILFHFCQGGCVGVYGWQVK